MTDLRTAAQQALEALEWLKVTPDPDLLEGHEWPIRWLDNWVTVTLTPPLLKSRGRATKLRAIQVSLGYQHSAAITALRAALAEPERKPLTEEQVDRAYQEIWRDSPDDFGPTAGDWIEAGIRYAERAHGISSEA